MTFSIIPEKYLKEDINYVSSLSKSKFPSLASVSDLQKNKNGFIMKKRVTLEDNLRMNNNNNNNIVDNMILSHLSTKRKEFNSDRFRKIFEKFDSMIEELILKRKNNIY